MHIKPPDNTIAQEVLFWPEIEPLSHPAIGCHRKRCPQLNGTAALGSQKERVPAVDRRRKHTQCPQKSKWQEQRFKRPEQFAYFQNPLSAISLRDHWRKKTWYRPADLFQRPYQSHAWILLPFDIVFKIVYFVLLWLY